MASVSWVGIAGTAPYEVVPKVVCEAELVLFQPVRTCWDCVWGSTGNEDENVWCEVSQEEVIDERVDAQDCEWFLDERMRDE